MNDDMMLFALLLNTIFILGGVIVIIMAMSQRTKKLEMMHRERMAMIDRGLLPSPEVDPEQFEASMGRPGVSRYTTLGIAIVGLGMGLMLIIGVAGGAPDAGVGVGGAIVVLGLAFVANGYLQRASQPLPPPPPPRYRAPYDAPRVGPSEPPGRPGQ
jgi:hypothetical protein